MTLMWFHFKSWGPLKPTWGSIDVTVPVGGAQEVFCVAKGFSMDLHSQILYEAGVKILKMNSWENFEKTQF